MELLEYLSQTFGPSGWTFYSTLLFVFLLELLNPDKAFTASWSAVELGQTLLLFVLISVLQFYVIELVRSWYISENSTLLTVGIYADHYLNGWVNAFLGLFLFDLFFYWKHRFLHQTKLWPLHAVHHSATRLNFTVGFRGHPVDDAFTTLVFLTIFHIFLESGTGLYVLLGYSLYQASLHSNTEISFGPLNRFIVSPAVHKVHHQIGDDCLDKNFASTFSIFDVIFGTYLAPEKAGASDYGIKHGPAFKNTVDLLIKPIRLILNRN